MKGNNALYAFVAVLVTIIILSVLDVWSGKEHSDAIMTGLIGLAGGFTLGRMSHDAR